MAWINGASACSMIGERLSEVELVLQQQIRELWEEGEHLDAELKEQEQRGLDYAQNIVREVLDDVTRKPTREEIWQSYLAALLQAVQIWQNTPVNVIGVSRSVRQVALALNAELLSTEKVKEHPAMKLMLDGVLRIYTHMEVLGDSAEMYYACLEELFNAGVPVPSYCFVPTRMKERQEEALRTARRDENGHVIYPVFCLEYA